MDILLDTDGDLHITKEGDIAIDNSVAQKIRIKLLWFEGEWRWNTEEGMPYMSDLLVKNPDTDYLEGIIRSTIFEVDEVTEVREVKITINKQTRNAVIQYVALTDYETIKEEVKIRCQITE